MARKKKTEPELPADILAMSLDELRKESEAQFSKENEAIFDALVEARDKAQAAVTAHNTRNFQINQRFVQLLREKNGEA